ncbi:MAG: NlpC/P60 family protein, partial [Pseudomonadota bacterium]
MDRRTTPANARVAASALRGHVEAPTFTDGEPRTVADPLVDLCKDPGGARDRQMLLGDLVQIFEDRDGWSFVQSAKDDYVGYVPTNSLTAPKAATHWVAVPAGHAYTEPDIKAPVAHPLYFGTRIAMATHMPKFYETTDGVYIPKPILRPLEHRFSDPATVAQMFFGAPYLWGGNSVAGIDCSGLIQAAHLACGIPCPGD